MTWEARFENGPRKGDKRIWEVGPVWNEIRVAPIPERSKAWFISGGDGIPEPRLPANVKIEPWPGEVRYALERTRHTRLKGEAIMVAYYRLAKDASAPAR